MYCLPRRGLWSRSLRATGRWGSAAGGQEQSGESWCCFHAEEESEKGKTGFKDQDQSYKIFLFSRETTWDPSLKGTWQIPSALRALWGLLCEKYYCLTDQDVEGKHSCEAARWPGQTQTDVTLVLMRPGRISLLFNQLHGSLKSTLMLFPARLSHSRWTRSFSPSIYPILLFGRFRIRKLVSFETPIMRTSRFEATDSCEQTAGDTDSSELMTGVSLM